MEVKGKVAVITGGAAGIGRTTAELLVSLGAAVMIADVNRRDGHNAVSAIESSGGRAAFVRTDVTDANSVRQMLETTVEQFGRLDILHNNAGIMLGPGFLEAPLDRWRRVLDIDLQAVILGTYLAAPIMQRLGGGVIINTASMSGLYPNPQDPVYGAAKAGVVSFTHSLAPWAAERNIRVNCICPGVTKTEFVSRMMEKAAAAGRDAGFPAKMLKPQVIAQAVLRFIQDDSLVGQVFEARPSGTVMVPPRSAPARR
jgi:NAD(P)-dependent dehydrogenase (short-subunit alcohol dehydrogenase family)